MELPAIKLPQIDLPFDIPVLLHPPVDHFMVALPVLVLLLEITNLILKRRAVGVTAFFFLVLMIVAAVAAYLTGSVDGKEVFPLLSDTVQSELKAHKLFGTYLMFAAVVVLLFKILSVTVKRGLIKALYLLILILFVAGILKQGKEGGELVYKYGVNVEKVQALDNELDDLKEELEESGEAEQPSKPEKKEAVIPENVGIPKKTSSETNTTVKEEVAKKTLKTGKKEVLLPKQKGTADSAKVSKEAGAKVTAH